MRKWFKNIRRSLLIAMALVLLGSGAVSAVVYEVVKDLPGSATLIQAEALSDSSLGIYQDASATLPMTNVGFGDVTGFRYNIGQGSSTASVPVYIKNQSGGQLLVGISSDFSQGTVELVSATSQALTTEDRTLDNNEILPAKLKLSLNEGFTAGSQSFTVNFVGQTIVGASGPTFTTLTTGLTGILEDVAFKPDGSYALIPSRNGGNVYKYDGDSFTTLASGGNQLSSVSWKPDGSLALFSASTADGIRTYNGTSFAAATSGNNAWTYNSGWKPGVSSYALIVGENYLYKYDGTFTEIATDVNYQAVAWKPDVDTYATITQSGSVDFFKYTGGITPVDAGTAGNSLSGAAWKPDGSYALMVGSGGYVQKYDGTTVTPLTSGTTKYLWDVAWKPDDGAYALLVGMDGTVLKYDGTSFTALDAGVSGTDTIYAVGWKPDGSYALLVTYNGTVVKFTP